MRDHGALGCCTFRLDIGHRQTGSARCDHDRGIDDIAELTVEFLLQFDHFGYAFLDEFGTFDRFGEIGGPAKPIA